MTQMNQLMNSPQISTLEVLNNLCGVSDVTGKPVVGKGYLYWSEEAKRAFSVVGDAIIEIEYEDKEMRR